MTNTKHIFRLNRHRMLLVDDQKGILFMLKRILSLHLTDCRIDIAVNGAEAVDAFREGHHGILIMDLHMPEKDGYTAFLDIQKICAEENSEMPAVIFHSSVEKIPKAIRDIIEVDSHHCFLRKPATHTELLDVLKARLNS
jgi:CheY-like chemotaxis protein